MARTEAGELEICFGEKRNESQYRRKTEYMCVNERQVKGTVKMQGEEVAKVEDFK